MSCCLERVALGRMGPVGPSGTVPSGNQSQVLQGCPLCRLHMPSFCSWATVAAGLLVVGVDQSDWLWGCTTMTADELFCGGLLHGVVVTLVRLWDS